MYAFWLQLASLCVNPPSFYNTLPPKGFLSFLPAIAFLPAIGRLNLSVWQTGGDFPAPLSVPGAVPLVFLCLPPPAAPSAATGAHWEPSPDCTL